MLSNWFVYVLVSSVSNATYVGIAKNPSKRLRQHNGEVAGGAKSTRANRPWEIKRILGPYSSRSVASKAECIVKKAKGLNRLVINPSF